jgi:predicted MFS family arabinose efflux permease
MTGHDETPRSAWVLLAFLTALNVLNFVDRQLIASLAPLLIAELKLSRAQIGLLVGFAFVFFYTLMGLALGVLADRLSRTRLIAVGLGLWSAMTAVSGAATGFAHLAAARVLVGVGEATLTPAALAMLGDAFPRGRLGLAIGVYYAGIPLGVGLSLVLAGFIAPLWGWRACFYALGIAGLLAVAALLLLREPPRRGAVQGAVPPALREIAAELLGALRSVPALGLTILGACGLAYAAGAALHVLTWLVQERGLEFRQAAFTAGGIAAVAGFLGNLGGGALADWCGRRWAGGRLWALVALTLALAPISTAYFLLPPGSPLFYLCWLFASASTTAWFGPVFAVIQQLSPVAIRSTTVAFALLALNLLGVGPGPWITGMIGDSFSLTAGLLSSVGVAVVSTIPLALGARRLPRS